MARGAAPWNEVLGNNGKVRLLALTMTAANLAAAPVASSGAIPEAALYPPVKAFLERQGYTVRGEVRGCDLVARRGDEPLVIVELKTRFTLALLLQGVDRLAMTPLVYVAVPRPLVRARGIRPDARAARKLCRRLGLGLILIGNRGGGPRALPPAPFKATHEPDARRIRAPQG